MVEQKSLTPSESIGARRSGIQVRGRFWNVRPSAIHEAYDVAMWFWICPNSRIGRPKAWRSLA
jgi:hypothetical protein